MTTDFNESLKAHRGHVMHFVEREISVRRAMIEPDGLLVVSDESFVHDDRTYIQCADCQTVIEFDTRWRREYQDAEGQLIYRPQPYQEDENGHVTLVNPDDLTFEE